MVTLDTVRTINRDLVLSQPLVAVFVGGTGGIGALSLKAFAHVAAKHNGKGLRVYIVGRNAAAAERLIEECRNIYPRGQYYFDQAEDLSLVQNVDRICAQMLQEEERNAASMDQHPRIDYLMLSNGGSIFLPRRDTKEGIDETMARFYYSRIAFITHLMPLLLKSSLPATVISVYAAGMEAKLYAYDLSLRDSSHYSYLQARSHIVYMHTCFFEELSEREHNKIRLIHIFPGLVVHEGMHSKSNPWWLRILFGRVMPFLSIGVNIGESGERMVSLASPSYYPTRPLKHASVAGVAITGTDGQFGSGSYALTWTGESTYKPKRYISPNKQELRIKIWDHTNQALDDIRNQGTFRK